ncbi:hypothetical protein EJB05_00159, partial [Eragrostis curvula]
MARVKILDAAGQRIYGYDLVKFNKTPSGAHGDRGLATKSLRDKTIRVRCADGSMVVVKACDVTVVDRSAVCRTSVVTSSSATTADTDSSSSSGVVTGNTTALDLVRLSTGEVVARGVSTSEVQRDGELSLGDYVVMGPWLGQVVEVSLDVDVLFDDGAVCRVTQASRKLRTLDNDLGCGVFYLGQRVVASSSSVFEENVVFKAARWLKGRPYSRKDEEGTVAKVVVSGVHVYWLASSHLGTERTPLFQVSAPPTYQCNIQNLTLFSCSGDAHLMHQVWVVGERCVFRRSSTSSAQQEDDPNKSTSAAAAEPLCVANTSTTVDVLWQDGTQQYGVPSASLASLEVWNQHEFVPGQRVVHRDRDDGQCLGVVRSFNYKDQTACVSWIQASKEDDEDEETLSAYHLDLSSDNHLSYGSVVVRLRPTDSSPTREDGEEEAHREEEEDLSWIGKIVDLRDGRYIQVKWGDGNTSKVLLHEIAVVKPQSIEEMFHEIREDGPAPAADARSMGWANTVTQTVIRLVRIAKGMRSLLSRGAALSGGDVDDLAMESAAAVAPESDIRGGDSAQQRKTEADAIGGEDKSLFPHFDVQQSPPDHHYLNNMAEQGARGGTKWIKRVQKEWKILEDSIPDTMYVRAFEDRMDLLRVAMVGASGTPYQDGLFFFDLQLPPSSYPESPPLVNYRSFGLRLNPNLYESGTVCLSLLDTFGGEGAELWSPTTSTVLQVVVSIQGLVLTSQPYYNEAGYATQVGTPQGRRNELPYNENAYLLTLRTMLHLLRRPPAGFEAYVREHFCRRGRHVLRACNAYLTDGCTVGTLDGEARPTEVSRERPCSTGFRLALGNIVPSLDEVFKEIGADGCHYNRSNKMKLDK